MRTLMRLTSLPDKLTMKPHGITVRTIGTLDTTLAADLLAPLFLKIHERNQSKIEALRAVTGIQQSHPNLKY